MLLISSSCNSTATSNASPYVWWTWSVMWSIYTNFHNSYLRKGTEGLGFFYQPLWTAEAGALWSMLPMINKKIIIFYFGEYSWSWWWWWPVNSALQLLQLLLHQSTIIFDIDASKILTCNKAFKSPSFSINNYI